MNKKGKVTAWMSVGFALGVAGCASIPNSVDGDYNTISISEARNAGTSPDVRWGGVIAKVNNEAEQSVVEIVAKPLNRSTRPINDDATGGRFLAVFNDFIDPVIFTQGREITLVGTLSDVVEGKVGEMKYLYPVVKVTGHHLWRPRPEFQEINVYGPSFWPIFPYRYYYHPHWRFRPAPGTPGSRPQPIMNKPTKSSQKNK